MKKFLATYHLLLKNHSRIQALFYISVFGLLSGALLTLPQWSAVRTYPLIPVIPDFSLPAQMHTAVFILFMSTLTISLFAGKYRWYCISISLFSLGVLSLLDITRFHPWILHYIAVLLLFSLADVYLKDKTQLLDSARIIVGGIYFWSGVQKMNLYFISAVFPWFTQPMWQNTPELIMGSFFVLGIFVPFIEAFFALGLFSKRFRTLSVIGSTAMIFVVLLSIGPLGHNWNSSVWPWNIAIFLMVIVLFFKTDFTMKEFFTRTKQNTVGLVLFGIFWLLPIGNMFGFVDHYISWSLYSGHVPEATLYGDQLLLSSLSSAAQDGELAYTYWTIETMNQIPYPEERVFHAVFKEVCNDFENDSSLRLEIISSPYFSSLERSTVSATCTE